MIISLKTIIANHFKKSIIIYVYQVLGIDQFNKNDIKNFLNKTVYNQKLIIDKDEELLKAMINLDNTRYNIERNNLVTVLKPICRKIAIKKTTQPN